MNEEIMKQLKTEPGVDKLRRYNMFQIACIN